jgi:tripartite-type tricarboxylate transporter receptor subunit TctC
MPIGGQAASKFDFRSYCSLSPKGADMASARSKFVRLMGIAFTAITIPQFASAVDYPTRQVRWLVPMAAGDMPDILARVMGQWLSERLGQPFVIDNRPGAATNIGTEAAVRAPADGYTVVLLGPPAAINATLYDKLTFNVLRDIAPVAGIARAPNVMEVGLAVPVKTVRSGALGALAVAGKTRSDLLPGVPTIDETVSGYEAGGFDGIAVRKGTPPEIIERLNRDINDGAVQARLAELATRPRPLRPVEFASFVAAETEKWARVVKLSGAKPE